MLELRPNCERCDNDLAGESNDAYICSFECTFCRDCANQPLQLSCPNCGGILQPRPARSGDALLQYPASTKRTKSKS